MSQEKNTLPTLFTKSNYTWMLIGGLVIAVGFYLLSGGKSTDPAVFDTKEVYSTHRSVLKYLKMKLDDLY